MVVRDLIRILGTMDPDRMVIVQKDAEGNYFSPLCEVSQCAYKPENAWSGQVGLEGLTPTLAKEGYTIEDVLEGRDVFKAIVLKPVN